MSSESPPPEVREAVRTGVSAALAHDFELIGARTAGRLAAAGVIGVAGALGATLLVSGHPLAHHPPWHVLVFGTIWAGLLVVSLSLIFLRIRTPGLPIGQAAAVGVVGLGLAGLCSLLCPDPHFLNWWTATAPGAWATASGALAASALCFGFVTTVLIGATAGFLVLRGSPSPTAPILPAVALLLMLEPGIILQAVGASLSVLGGWTLGAGVGSYAGVASGLSLSSRLLRS